MFPRMTHQEVDVLFESASKVLHMDQSHDAIRSQIQTAISAQHRAENANSDSSSYYNTPYVRDVYGDGDKGTVVHSKDGKLTASKYKKGASGYELSGHKAVKQAYVADNDADDKKESLVVLIDGKETIMSEARAVELTEILELQEADSGKSTAKITLITAGKGTMGYYTESALKKAATDNIFSEGTQMFLNHQTVAERAARPEGDITKLAAKLTGPAVYVEGSGSVPGRLVAPAKIYPEFSNFIAARKDDIGVSVRVGATPSGKTKDGVPLVESMVYALSADFVTKAGRGGKIEELYESFRAEPGSRQPAARSNETMTKEEMDLFKTLQESVAAGSVRLDRLAEENAQLKAQAILSESLRTSNLKPRGQARVGSLAMANLPLKEDKSLDVVKFQEAIKAAIAEEVAYLQESGVQVGPQIVRQLGTTGINLMDEAGKAKTTESVLQEAAGKTDSAIDSILGRKEKKA